MSGYRQKGDGVEQAEGDGYLKKATTTTNQHDHRSGRSTRRKQEFDDDKKIRWINIAGYRTIKTKQ